MSFDFIVRRARVATASVVFTADIGITGGRILALAETLAAGPATQEIDAAGRFVTSGGIDSHCHIDQPMLPPVRMADNFETGSRSAACGGTTTIIPFAAQAKGGPLVDTVADYHQRAAGKSSVDYAFHLIVANPTRARGKGLNIFGETCPQYLFLTQEDLGLTGFGGARCVCSPPPRDKANQQVVSDALADGLFTVFSSDHAPFNHDDPNGKRLGGREPPFPHIPNGMPGLETRLPLLFIEGVLAGRISIQQFVALTAANAAQLYGLYPRKGTVAVGSDADLVIWDTTTPRTICNADLHHAVDYTPYEGREVQAWPLVTLLRGQVVWDGKAFTGNPVAGDGAVTAPAASASAAPAVRHTRLLIINPNINPHTSTSVTAPRRAAGAGRASGRSGRCRCQGAGQRAAGRPGAPGARLAAGAGGGRCAQRREPRPDAGLVGAHQGARGQFCAATHQAARRAVASLGRLAGAAGVAGVAGVAWPRGPSRLHR